MTEPANWPEVAKRTFWDRTVPFDAWHAGVAAGHRSYLPQSVKTMPPEQFIRFFGVQQFKSAWPAMRAGLKPEQLRHAAMLDRLWSRLVSGTWNLKPVLDPETLPRRQRECLLAAVRAPGITQYALSKALGMQYKQVHDSIKKFQALGLFKLVPKKGDARGSLHIYPC